MGVVYEVIVNELFVWCVWGDELLFGCFLVFENCFFKDDEGCNFDFEVVGVVVDVCSDGLCVEVLFEVYFELLCVL